MPPNYKTKKLNMAKAEMNNNNMFSKGISSKINFRKLDTNNADLKTKIKTKEMEIGGLKEIMKRKDMKAKKKEEIILRKIIKIQRMEILKSLEILNTKDPEEAYKLLRTLNLEEQMLKTRKFLDFNVSIKVEPEHEGITPRNSKGEPKGGHSEKLVFLVLLN